MAEFEYEYIAPNEGYRPFDDGSNLPSTFDPQIPAGIRGEAVRAAIRSGRCICWELSDTPLQSGWISVDGDGTYTFLDNKLSQSFDGTTNGAAYYKEACLLNTKGRVIDRLGVVSIDDTRAYILTSPGHTGSSLFQRLDPLIFPMDLVSLGDRSENCKMITIASTKLEDVKLAIETYILPLIETTTTTTTKVFPTDDDGCTRIELESSGTILTILPTAVVPKTALVGYTIIVEETKKENTNNLGERLWRNLISEELSPDGPIEIGALEFETLRIEAGMPAFRKELTASEDKKKQKRTPAGPFELHWGTSLVDVDKGCYLGQEGVASILRTKKGPPRLLYSIIFEYDDNIFDTESKGDKGGIENLTKLPTEESELFVLGSNNEISVGTLTSIAEPSSTGDPTMVGLALVKRPDRILKPMRERGLRIERRTPDDDASSSSSSSSSSGSRMVQPPPIDPLDGLEVIIKDTYTVGVLRCVPDRRYPKKMLFNDDDVYNDENEPTEENQIEVDYVNRDGGWVPEVDDGEFFIDTDDNEQPKNDKPIIEEIDDDDDVSSDNDLLETEINRATEEASKAQAVADAAAAEAERKETKLTALKQKAEEAMARRKAKTEETKRKEAKMALLKQKADEAMARRQQQQKAKTEEAAAEVERKETKMALLKQKADEAMARRQQQKAKTEEAERKETKMALLKQKADEAMARRQQKTEEAERKETKMALLKKKADEAMARRKAK